MLKKLELDALDADLTNVTSLLESRTEEDDPIGFYQFSARKAELEAEISQIESRSDNHAELGVFFGGGPVQGSRGINADFAGKALDDLQALITKRFLEKESGSLKQRGRLPFVDRSQMLVTGVMRGSFGFVLEESGDTTEMVATPLRDVVGEVSDILSRVGAADEAIFDEAAAELDERVLVTLKQFFQRLDEHEATLRIVNGNRDFLLDRNAVSLARSRVQDIEIVQRANEYVGQLFLLPASRRFDLVLADESVLKGSVAPEALKQLAGEQEFGVEPIDPRHISQTLWTVAIQTKEIHERNRATRFVHSLKHLVGPVEG